MWVLIRSSYEKLYRHDIDVDAAYAKFERYVSEHSVGPSTRRPSELGRCESWIARHKRIVAVSSAALTVVVALSVMIVLGALGIPGTTRSWAATPPVGQRSLISATSTPDTPESRDASPADHASRSTAEKSAGSPSLVKRPAGSKLSLDDGLSVGIRLGHAVSLNVTLASLDDSKWGRLRAVIRISALQGLSGTCSLTLTDSNALTSLRKPFFTQDSHLIKVTLGNSSSLTIRVGPITTSAQSVGCTILSSADRSTGTSGSTSLPGQISDTILGTIASTSKSLGLGIPTP